MNCIHKKFGVHIGNGKYAIECAKHEDFEYTCKKNHFIYFVNRKGAYGTVASKEYEFIKEKEMIL